MPQMSFMAQMQHTYPPYIQVKVSHAYRHPILSVYLKRSFCYFWLDVMFSLPIIIIIIIIFYFVCEFVFSKLRLQAGQTAGDSAYAEVSVEITT